MSTQTPLPRHRVRAAGLAGLAGRGARVLRASSEDRANGQAVANVLDGDPSTFRHTRWQPRQKVGPAD